MRSILTQRPGKLSSILFFYLENPRAIGRRDFEP
jgi:hypothetical protein